MNGRLLYPNLLNQAGFSIPTHINLLSMAVPYQTQLLLLTVKVVAPLGQEGLTVHGDLVKEAGQTHMWRLKKVSSRLYLGLQGYFQTQQGPVKRQEGKETFETLAPSQVTKSN
jgi:hypothetical protein